MDLFPPVHNIPNRILVDKRAITQFLEVQDLFTNPGGTGDAVTIRVNEIPLEGIVLSGYTGIDDDIVVELAGSPFTKFEKIDSGAPVSGQFLVDDDTYLFGYMGLSPDDSGADIVIKYTGKGSKVFSSDVNELSNGTLIGDGVIGARHIAQDQGFTFGQELFVVGMFKPPVYSVDPSLTLAMIGSIYFNSSDGQYKGVISDGEAGAMIVILG